MSIIQVSNLSFTYDGSYEPVFDNVSFELDTSWKLGLIGRNGRGKTTLMRLLCGQLPFKGTINSSVKFEYFPFSPKDKDDFTLDLIRDFCPSAEDWQIRKETLLLDLDEDVLWRPFSTLSGGEQVKALLAAMFLKEDTFFLIDEPTNHLDLDGRASVSKYLKSKSGFIVVSHDRTFLDGCVDHVMSINKAGIEIKRGNFSVWNENRIKAEQFEMSENEKLKNEIAKLSKASEKTANWADKVEATKNATRDSGLRPDRGYIGHKSAKMMKRATAMQKRADKKIEEKSSLLKNTESTRDIFLQPLKHPRNVLAEFKNVSVAYAGNTVFKGLSFSVEQGQKIFLTGKNGCGKSTVLKILAECSGGVSNAASTGTDIQGNSSLCATISGTVETASGLKISYVPQDISKLTGSLDSFISENGLDRTLFMTVLRNLDFSRALFDRDMSGYSDGQKKKVYLAKSLSEHAHLYIWDEPLNHIDILSRLQVEQALADSPATMLIVEHDQKFHQIATQTIDM